MLMVEWVINQALKSLFWRRWSLESTLAVVLLLLVCVWKDIALFPVSTPQFFCTVQLFFPLCEKKSGKWRLGPRLGKIVHTTVVLWSQFVCFLLRLESLWDFCFVWGGRSDGRVWAGMIAVKWDVLLVLPRPLKWQGSVAMWYGREV